MNYDSSREKFSQILEEQGPFDGAFGFSQGAAFLTAFVGALESSGGDSPFRFLILCGGVPPADKSVVPKNKVATRNVHIIGDNDPLKSMSEALCDMYENPTVVASPAGHQPPSARHSSCFPAIAAGIFSSAV